MEQIKKRIYLNPYISRQNSYIPYIVRDVEETPLIMDGFWIEVSTFSPNGNWGKYPYDIDLNRCENFVDDNGDNVTPNKLKDYFFNPRKIPFREMADKYSLLHSILYNASYYKTIVKNNRFVWVSDEPSLGDKIDIEVVSELPEPTEDGKCIGVYEDDSFAENGGNHMLRFLFRAMGMFIVHKAYLTPENGIPEVMYYAGIDSYLKSMERVRDSEECCQNKHFEFLGGNVFYGYLKHKQSLIEDEIKYWHKALCRGEYNEILEPNINMAVALNGECFSIGNYMTVSDIKAGSPEMGRSDSLVREFTNESMLKYLRRSTITYCTDINDNSMEFPFILDVYKYKEGEEEVAEQYELTQPYMVGYPKNLKETNGKYYGDIIYRMDFLKNYHYNSVHKVEETTYFDANGNIISGGGGYQSFDDFIAANPEWSDYTPTERKENGAADEEYDVWDDPEAAKNQGLYEFSNKTEVGKKIPQYKYEYDNDGNIVSREITGYTQTFSTELFDFDKSDGVVHIFYEIGGRLRKVVNEQTNKITWEYYDDFSEGDFVNFSDFVKLPQNKLSAEDYLFLKKEFEIEDNYNDEIIYKGDITKDSSIVFPEEESGEFWVYKIPEKGTYVLNSIIEECFEGDYIIVNETKTVFHFNMKLVNNMKFTGVRYYERRNWTQYDYTKDYTVFINLLSDDKASGYQNILANTNYVRNADNVELVTYDNMNDDVTGLFYSNDGENLDCNLLLMNDNDFGRVEMYVENSADVVIDRGFVSAFEMHYKLGEINTMEDMENYGNNFFGF